MDVQKSDENVKNQTKISSAAQKLINKAQSSAIKNLSGAKIHHEEKKTLQLSSEAINAQKNELPENLISELFKSSNVKTISEYYFLAPLFQENQIEKQISDRMSEDDYEKFNANKQNMQKLSNGIFSNTSAMYVKFDPFDYNSGKMPSSEEIFNFNSIVFPAVIDILKIKHSFIAAFGFDYISSIFGIQSFSRTFTPAVQCVSTGIQILKFFSKFNDEIKSLTGCSVKISIGISTGVIKTGFIGKCKKTDFHIAGLPLIESKQIAEYCYHNEIGAAENSIEAIEQYYGTFYDNSKDVMDDKKIKFHKIMF